MAGITNKFSKWTPMANPIRYAISTNQRLECFSLATFSHLRIHQKVSVVKKLEEAYTSASTAENQKVSEKVNVNAPTAPAPIMASVCQLSKASPALTIIFLAKWVIVQNINITVSALVTAETMFTQKATLLGSDAIRLNTLPIIRKSGAPGG